MTPELPEVETIRRDLEQCISKSTMQISWYRQDSPVLELLPDPKSAYNSRKMVGLKRLGKYLIVEFSPWGSESKLDWRGGLSKSKPRFLVFSLGMSGQIFRTDLFPLQEVLEGHNHVHMVLRPEKGGCAGQYIVFRDPRGFGKIFHTNRSGGDYDHPKLVSLGPDALEVTTGDFIERAGKSKRAVKNVLMDQAVLAGIGNIYASEILFRAGIHPENKAVDLTEGQWMNLSQYAKIVLGEAIDHRGSTISDFVGGNGEPGTFQKYHRVYGRTGQPCLNAECLGKIEKASISGRSTFFCPNCQK